MQIVSAVKIQLFPKNASREYVEVVALSVLSHSDENRKIRPSQFIKRNFLSYGKVEQKRVLPWTAGLDAKVHSAITFESVDIEVGGIFNRRIDVARYPTVAQQLSLSGFFSESADRL
jgi:hypothetical protein